MSPIKEWVAWLFAIPRIFTVAYEKDGKKILTVATTQRGRETVITHFHVEHLLDNNLQVTEQTLAHEKDKFIKVSSNK